MNRVAACRRGARTEPSVPSRRLCNAAEAPLSTSGNQDNRESQEIDEDEGTLAMIFTCSQCGHRQGKHFSKLSYNKGVVIVKCSGCGVHHLIADRLGWFDHQEHRSVEEMLAARGEKVARIGPEDALEFLQAATGEDLRRRST